MRTKTLLLTAAIGAAGLASTVAQPVYSVNAVGYINVTVPAGAFSIIANQLRQANSTLPAIIPAPPLGSTVYEFTPGSGFAISTYDLDDDSNPVWSNPNIAITPGEGVWFRNNGGSPFTMTFVGEVPEGAPLSHSVAAGFSLQSSQVPQSGGLSSVLGYTPGLGDTVYLFNPVSGYSIHTYDLDDDSNPNWTSEPVPAVGQGFWVRNAGATKNWTRTFDVTP